MDIIKNNAEIAFLIILFLSIVCMPLKASALTCYLDGDADGFGDIDNTIFTAQDECPSGWVSNALDCDDGESTIFPGAPEVLCDGVDQNCNGLGDDVMLV